MPIGYNNIHIQIMVSDFTYKLISLLFCEFNTVASWNGGKTIIILAIGKVHTM